MLLIRLRLALVAQGHLRLIVKLPPTQWIIYQNDPKYSALIESLAPNVLDMLKRTRPLFVQYILNAFLEKELWVEIAQQRRRW
mmetsp:Transcript_17569/g.24136  ORF Transcript_17569/g.24136 Transcript_17569/m.24136 type:complete len:83 (+) Transcript_17569:632-880(+)